MIDIRRHLANPNAPAAQPVPLPSPRTLSSGELLQGKQEIFIQHGTEIYRLRQTRTGKLLLYK